MNNNQEFFISLLYSHLNNEIPELRNDINWFDVYKLSELQNLTGIIALEMKKLPKNALPKAKGQAYFQQALGLSIQNAQIKMQTIEFMNSILDKAEIKHTIIKGGAIRSLYPVPEVRISGDTDIVIDELDKPIVKELLLKNGFELMTESVNQLVLLYLEQEFQFKTYYDCLSKIDGDYFSYDVCELQQNSTYFLEPTYHLAYVINHLLKHIKAGGVGLRQLMDVDVIIRKQKIDLNKLFNIMNDMKLEKSSKAILDLSKKLFNTPIDIECSTDDEVLNHLVDLMLNGGVFGYGISNAGTVRLANSDSKLKALINMIFPSKEYMYNHYLYANKHHWLLPFAYIQRFFEAVFFRGKQNTKNLKSILNDDINATMLADIQKELEI